MNLFKPLNEIGLEIKQKREALGWNQTELARRAGVGRQVISGLETGAAKDAKWSTLTGLHLALGGLDVLAKEDVPQGYKEKETDE